MDNWNHYQLEFEKLFVNGDNWNWNYYQVELDLECIKIGVWCAGCPWRQVLASRNVKSRFHKGASSYTQEFEGTRDGFGGNCIHRGQYYCDVIRSVQQCLENPAIELGTGKLYTLHRIRVKSIALTFGKPEGS